MNQSIDLKKKTADSFLCDSDLRYERVKDVFVTFVSLIHNSCITYANMFTLYYIIYNISMICKNLVFWTKKTSPIKKLHFFEIIVFSFKFSDENDRAKLVGDM